LYILPYFSLYIKEKDMIVSVKSFGVFFLIGRKIKIIQ
jgi:hypothetical protein